ncbi:LysR family transcriptional regulator [Phaeovulum vinaykumarii]|uniref:LysR family transcriptional regulator, nitrogen assimilation regulatory protein n=1 Tax=Phaeovulum vinaykumarii TaxID=407234 RepID=A0A1N7MKJ7_9RHOB|nr:LysR family transcriptional regulator [Phaeovulum vinaykumarii]SIS86633.1 LysR family transcriptional regulator, nitrogen assimilation regulatory protein [Phaeovulum vinaykumarii]SOC13479.1 LysR family nitrogen assimilation transcriptional regulator [Phaeovulum vinaykumarii]
MDLRQFRYFIAIVEDGSVSAAARRLNIAQPALSLHLRNMEAELGTRLLVRSPRGVTPTDAGRLLCERGRHLLDAVEDTLAAVRAFDAAPEGEVQIGLPGTLAELLAAPLVLAMRRRFPKVRLRVAEAMSGFVRGWLAEGRVDLGLIYMPMGGRGLRPQPVLSEELRLFATTRPAPLPDLPDVPFDPGRLAGLPLVLPGPAHGLRVLLDAEIEARGTRLTRVVEVESYKAIKALVLEGLGFSVLPVNAISAEVASGHLRWWPLGTPPLRRQIHLALTPARPPTKAALAVERVCRETLEELTATGRWRLNA